MHSCEVKGHDQLLANLPAEFAVVVGGSVGIKLRLHIGASLQQTILRGTECGESSL